MLRRYVGGADVAVALLVLVVLGVIVGLGVGNKQEGKESRSGVVSEESQSGIVSYELTGTGRASRPVYYIEGSDKEADDKEHVTLPWRSRPIIVADKTQPKGVAAFHRDAGEITCKIYLDGKVVAKSTSADGSIVCRADIF